MGTERNDFGTRDWEKTSAYTFSVSEEESAVLPFELRDGMEGEHPPEIDFTRDHHDVEKRDWMESSALKLEMFTDMPQDGRTCEPHGMR